MRWRFTAMCDRRPPANVIHRPVSHHSRGVLLRVISHSYNQCVCVCGCCYCGRVTICLLLRVSSLPPRPGCSHRLVGFVYSPKRCLYTDDDDVPVGKHGALCRCVLTHTHTERERGSRGMKGCALASPEQELRMSLGSFIHLLHFVARMTSLIRWEVWQERRDRCV